MGLRLLGRCSRIVDDVMEISKIKISENFGPGRNENGENVSLIVKCPKSLINLLRLNHSKIAKKHHGKKENVCILCKTNLLF